MMHKKHLFPFILVLLLPFSTFAVESQSEDELRMQQELRFLINESKTIKANIPAKLDTYKFDLTKSKLIDEQSIHQDSVSLGQSAVMKKDNSLQLLQEVEEMDQKNKIEFTSERGQNPYKTTRKRSR
jgi:hypothetical protein